MKTRLLILISLIVAIDAHARTATWNLNPATGDWNMPANWTPRTVPNGPSQIAIFQLSNITSISLSADTEVNSIVFDPGASAYTIIAEPPIRLTISGTGITNNSGTTQNFVTAVGTGSVNFGLISFTNSASAGSGTVFTNHNGPAGPGQTEFFDNSTAGSATFINDGGAGSGDVIGLTYFTDESTADNATIANNGGASGAANGETIFDLNANAGNAMITNNAGAPGVINLPHLEFRSNSSAGSGTFVNNGGTANGAFGSQTQISSNATADHGTFINNGGTVSGAQGGLTIFQSNATAASATLIANGGTGGGGGGAIVFSFGSQGGMSRVEVFGSGNLDISDHRPDVTVGSIEGDGNVLLGANRLTVGSNDLDTTFAGLIDDTGLGGSIRKIGVGTLILSNSNTYTGGTTVNHGRLLVTNTTGSGTGSGSVQVLSGNFGGTGIVDGPVTIGTGTRPATLSPGDDGSGSLTIVNTITFGGTGTYRWIFDSKTSRAESLTVQGVTIESGALFSPHALGNFQLPIGNVFVVINNTAATPIAGGFVNLPNGGIISVNGNRLQASYTGGDGNDLTLTVVP